MPINSKAKGSAGEREAANLFKQHGFTEARRSQQYSGAGHTADLTGIDGLHIEVKRVERLNIYDAIEQVYRDKAPTDYGVVMHRKNNQEWLITMTFDEWIELYKNYVKGNEK